MKPNCNKCGKPFKKRVPSPTCDACREAKAAERLFSSKRHGSPKTPTSVHYVQKLEVVQSERIFHYHIAEQGSRVAACGRDGIQPTQLTLKEWQSGAHKAGRWCKKCTHLAQINGWLDEVDLS